MTEHEDIELGRCVLHHTGVGCTKSYEMGTLFKNNYHVKETDAESLSAVFKDVAEHSGIFYSEKIKSSFAKFFQKDFIEVFEWLLKGGAQGYLYTNKICK